MFLQPMPKREREKKNAFAVLLCIHYIKEKAFAHWHHCYSKGPCSHPKSLYIRLAVSFFYEAEFDILVESVSKELNRLAAILHVYAGGLIFMEYFFCHYFSKRKGKYFYTPNHFYSEKSSKRAK